MNKILNEEKLLNSDFLDRFIGFAQRYEQIIGNPLVSSVQNWIFKKEFDSIGYYLDCSSCDHLLPFTAEQFITMEPGDLLFWQDFITKKCAVLDERKALRQVFFAFYE